MPTQWEINQANLDRLAKPIDDYSDRKLALTLADIAREQSGRDEIAREGRADKRRIEIQNRDTLLKLALAGRAPADAPKDLKKISDDEVSRLRSRAKLVVGSHLSEREKNEKDYDSAYKELVGVASSKATVEEKRNAARLVLRSPEALKWLKEKEIKAIEHAIIDGDPEPIIEAAAKRAGKTGVFSDHPERGEAILVSFYTPLSESENLSKQAKFQAITMKLKEISGESLLIQKNLQQAYREHGEHVDPETSAKIQFGDQPPIQDAPMNPVSMPAPEDPNSVFDTAAKEDTAPSEKWSGAIPTKTRPAIEAVTEGLIPGVGAYAHNIQTGVGNIGRKLFTGSPQKPGLNVESVMSGGAGIGALERNAMPTTSLDVVNRVKSILDSQPEDLKKAIKHDAVMRYGVDNVNEAQSAIEDPRSPYHADAVMRSFQELKAFLRKTNGLPDVAPIGDDLSAP